MPINLARFVSQNYLKNAIFKILSRKFLKNLNHLNLERLIDRSAHHLNLERLIGISAHLILEGQLCLCYRNFLITSAKDWHKQWKVCSGFLEQFTLGLSQEYSDLPQGKSEASQGIFEGKPEAASQARPEGPLALVDFSRDATNWTSWQNAALLRI